MTEAERPMWVRREDEAGCEGHSGSFFMEEGLTYKAVEFRFHSIGNREISAAS